MKKFFCLFFAAFFCSLLFVHRVVAETSEEMHTVFMRKVQELRESKKDEQYARIFQKIAAKKEVVAALQDIVEGSKKAGQMMQGVGSLLMLLFENEEAAEVVFQEYDEWVAGDERRVVVVPEDLCKKLVEKTELDARELRLLRNAVAAVDAEEVVERIARLILLSEAATDALVVAGEKNGGALAEAVEGVAQFKAVFVGEMLVELFATTAQVSA